MKTGFSALFQVLLEEEPCLNIVFNRETAEKNIASKFRLHKQQQYFIVTIDFDAGYKTQ